jgi:formylglycine-generating enzyme
MEENDNRGRFIKAETIDKQLIGKNYLLMIGINSYEHIKKLNYAVSDTLAVKDLLTKRYHFEENSATILLNEQASRNAIMQTFRSLVGKLEANDSLLIYYAGHGHYDDIFDMGYWIPGEGKQDEIGTYIPNSDLINAISRIKAKHIFLVSDSCFSGTLLAETRDSFTDRAKTLPSRWGLCSGRKELVLDKSYFAQSFISFLQENQEKELLVRHLIDYVEKNTANNTEQTPFGSRLRNVGDGGGEFVFHLKANESETEQTDFEKLKNAYFAENKDINTIQQLIHQLDDFLEKYPKSTHKKEIRTWLKVSEDEKEWIEACQKNKISAYRDYQENNPEGNYFEKASQKISEIRKKEITISQKPIKEEPKQEPIIKTNPQSSPNIPLIIPLANKTNLEMVYVEGGIFEMGYKKGRDGEDNDYMKCSKPLHQLRLDSFYVGKFTVTQEQYYAVMSKDSNSKFRGDKLPEENISWIETQEFMKKLNEKTGKNFRLPTEAEWEYAARGGNQGKGFMYAGSNDIKEVAWYGGNSGGKTHDVGLKMPNELGIYDMTGNVWEWCEDYYDEKFYEKSAGANLMNKNETGDCVIRGGCWRSTSVICRIADRHNYSPTAQYSYLGFRLVLSL